MRWIDVLRMETIDKLWTDNLGGLVDAPEGHLVAECWFCGDYHEPTGPCHPVASPTWGIGGERTIALTPPVVPQ